MKLALFVAANLCLLPFVSAQKASADFPEAGFSIAPLDPKPTGQAAPQLVASFMLPAAGGFAANVNVMIIGNHPNIKSFTDITHKELEAMALKISHEDQSTPNTWSGEYTGTQNGRFMHFYLRAVWKDGRVYLATATALDADWEKVSAQMKACVDSLKLK